jgi:beta-lactam-binding protein with PASTA domain
MSGAPRWSPGWLTLTIAGAAGFLLGVVVLVAARGIVHDEARTVRVTRTRTVVVQPQVPNVVGSTLDDARAALRGAGYATRATGGSFFRGPQGDDTVRSQDPGPGTNLAGGAVVTVDVG